MIRTYTVYTRAAWEKPGIPYWLFYGTLFVNYLRLKTFSKTESFLLFFPLFIFLLFWALNFTLEKQWGNVTICTWINGISLARVEQPFPIFLDYCQGNKDKDSNQLRPGNRTFAETTSCRINKWNCEFNPVENSCSKLKNNVIPM